MNSNAPALIIPAPVPGTTNSQARVDIRPAKPPVVIPSGWTWLWWTLAALALVALGWWLWRRRRKQGATEPAEVLPPPHVRARERLRAALALLGQPEPFCVEVSSAVRVYLEERFELHAPDRTTEEFLEELQTSVLLALSQKRSLADFLGGCDLVKFARYQPGEPALRELYDAAVRLIEETEPRAMATAGSAVAATAPETRPASS